MASLGGQSVDCTSLLERLEGYNARPSPPGMTWAHNNWHDPQAVVDRIFVLAKERRLKQGKGKALVCAVLGATLVAAQRDKCVAQQAEGETIKSLQDLMKVLHEQLENEIRSLSDQLANTRVANQRLHTALTEALERERVLREQLDETRSQITVENVRADSDGEKESKSYPFEDLGQVREIHSLGTGEAMMRPLIKTETLGGGQGGAQQVTTRIVPYSPTDLAKIQEKCSRGPRETEPEYVWRVSLTGGYHILLSEDEARGYWGPGVFLTTNDNREPWSLTQRVAYWVGGLDPMERGDPFSIKMPTVGHILETVQKAVRLQLMHDQFLVPQQPSPMQYVADPERLHPLIRGLPNALKLPIWPPDNKRYTLWTEGMSKGIPREVMDGLPTPNLDPELHYLMVTSAKAALDLRMPNEPLLVGPSQGPSAHQRPIRTSPEEHRGTVADENANQGLPRNEHLVPSPSRGCPSRAISPIVQA
ncbi:uncharacterized protein ACIBXB_006280 [Morphnus guianensis]